VTTGTKKSLINGSQRLIWWIMTLAVGAVGAMAWAKVQSQSTDCGTNRVSIQENTVAIAVLGADQKKILETVKEIRSDVRAIRNGAE
jgi:hypothetical protein